jgi:hypothetical protein
MSKKLSKRTRVTKDMANIVDAPIVGTVTDAEVVKDQVIGIFENKQEVKVEVKVEDKAKGNASSGHMSEREFYALLSKSSQLMMSGKIPDNSMVFELLVARFESTITWYMSVYSIEHEYNTQKKSILKLLYLMGILQRTYNAEHEDQKPLLESIAAELLSTLSESCK